MVVRLLHCRLFFFAFDGPLTWHKLERVFFVLGVRQKCLVMPNLGRLRRTERLVVFSLSWLSDYDFPSWDLCLKVIDTLVWVEQRLRACSLGEVRFLKLAKMIVELLSRKFLWRVVVIGKVLRHAAETGLRHAAVTDLGLASLNIPRGDDNLAIFVSEVLLDFLVVSKMVKGSIVRQTDVLSRPEGSVMLSSFRKQFTVPHHILSRIDVNLAINVGTWIYREQNIVVLALLRSIYAGLDMSWLGNNFTLLVFFCLLCACRCAFHRQRGSAACRTNRTSGVLWLGSQK